MADIPPADLPPAMKSTWEKIAQQRKDKQATVDQIVENTGEWGKVVNRLLETDDGRYFVKYLLRYCKIFSIDDAHNQMLNIETNGKRKVYLELIRPHLDSALRADLENQ